MSEMSHTPCPQVMAQLWAYIDGELTAEHRTLMQKHLEVCSACYPQYDFQRAFCAFLRRHGEHPVPAGLRRKIFEQLLQEDRACDK